MSHSLEIHAASRDERIDFYRQTYETWGRGHVTVDEHIAARMNSAQHNRATWFVGCVNGRLVCGLGSYPMQFRLHGQCVNGIAIGSVHTAPEFRRRGLASRLLPWVENYEHNRGAALSILYSDIEPAFYERLGYHLCANWEGWIEPGQLRLDPDVKLITLAAVSPAEFRPWIEKLYGAYHAEISISVARDRDYWDYIFAKGARDQFFRLPGTSGRDVGYMHLGVRDNAANIRDWAVADHSAESARCLFTAVIRRARESGLSRIGGWLPESPVTKNLFELKPRTRELTMLKPLSGEAHIDEQVLRAAQHLREIDHV